MGDYVKIVCAACGKGVSATYFDGLKLCLTVTIPECSMCNAEYDVGYGEGYGDGYREACLDYNGRGED